MAKQNELRWQIYSERRSQTIGSMIKPEWVAHLLGITLNGTSGDQARNMLRKAKVRQTRRIALDSV